MKTLNLFRSFQFSCKEEKDFINAKKSDISRSNFHLLKRMLLVYASAVPCFWVVLSFAVKNVRPALHFVSAGAVFFHIMFTLWVYLYSGKHTMSYRFTQNVISFFGFTIMAYATLVDVIVMGNSEFAVFPPVLIMLSLVYVYPKKRICLRVFSYASLYLAVLAVSGADKSFSYVLVLVLASVVISFIVADSESAIHLQNYRSERMLVIKEKRFRQALRMSSVEIWEYDYKKDDMNCCVDYSITGFFRWTPVPQSLIDHGLFRKDHEDSAIDFFNRMKLGEPCGKPFVASILCSDGTYKWVSAVYNIIHNDSGEPDTALFSIEDINEIKSREIELSKKAERDSMTKLLNRGTFTKLVDKALSMEGDNIHDSMLIIIDIDKLKEINDTFGHAAGDYVINEIANRMREYFGNNALLGRLGGDEFGIFIKDINSRAAAKENARILCERLSNLSDNDGHNFPASCSLGAAFAPESGKSFYELYLCADNALYESKKNGKNRLSVYRSDFIA